MGEYFTPGVYIEDKTGAVVIESKSNSIGGFIGVAERGPINKAVFITSWNAFINNFAFGMDSPFLAASDLAYAVYGFFQNGGKKCYVVRAAGSAAKKAEYKGMSTFTINALEEGAWGNKLKVKVTANAAVSANFDVEVTYGTEVVETFTNVSNTTTDENYWIEALAASQYVRGVTGTLAAAVEAVALSAGADGEVNDAAITGALVAFDAVSDMTLLCTPGQTSATVTKAVLAYAEKNSLFALVDAPKASTVESVKELRKTTKSDNGVLLFPFLRVSDPLSRNGKMRDCPSCGHIMGVYSRIIQNRGVWKAPAGTEAVVKGALALMTDISSGELGTLNELGIVSTIVKTNYGIVVWGARSLSSLAYRKYVSDVLLDIYIKRSIYDSTQEFVFEANEPATWRRLSATVQSFLDTLWRDGGLLGEKAADAYYVKCDADLNDEAARAAGKLICEVGYASKKPAEFIIFRVSHTMTSGN